MRARPEAEGRMETAGVTRDTVSAGFGERFVAVVIDWVVILIIGAIVRIVFSEAFAALIGIFLGVAYATYFWTSNGQTPGKAAMGLKVVRADGGGLLDFGTSILRYVGYIVSGLPLFLGYLWVIWDPKHDAWHDKIAGTKVIKVPK
jgi:uncharacterized RDD family membrane protein YckC